MRGGGNVFRERLRGLRRKKGLSQQVLSDQCGIATHAIARYERGQRCPSVKNLEILADFFGVSTDYLLGRAEK